MEFTNIVEYDGKQFFRDFIGRDECTGCHFYNGDVNCPNELCKGHSHLIQVTPEEIDIRIKLLTELKKTIMNRNFTDKEINRQMSLVPGTKVKMQGCAEEQLHKNKVWTVIHGPQAMGGGLVVWLDGYSGAFSCEYLQIVNE